MPARAHYELMELLAKDRGIIEAPHLWNIDKEQLYAWALEILSQPLADGSPSPFSNKDATSGHAILMEGVTEFAQLLGQELDIVPDYQWIQMMRMLGYTRGAAEYAVIELEFQRIYQNRAAIVPVGTRIQSNRDRSLWAITQQHLEFRGSAARAIVPARLSRIGSSHSSNLQPGEFAILPRSLDNIDRVRNTGRIVNRGKDLESLVKVVERIRYQMQRRTGLCTIGDFYRAAQEVGAQKINARTIFYGVGGVTDALELTIYPPDLVGAVDEALRKEELFLEGSLFSVVPANIVPISGAIGVKFADNIPPSRHRGIVGTAIAKKLNPPHGKFGDRDFKKSLASVLEYAEGIYAVPWLELRHSQTRQPVEEIEISHRDLMLVVNSLQVISA